MDSSSQKRKKLSFNLPMWLTWGRIALIPLIVGVFMLPESVMNRQTQNSLGCLFFVVAAVTDALDGFIARRFGMGTALGAFLDQVADKLMVSAALIVLLAFGRVDMFVALIIIGREITVTALREWMAKIGESGRVKVNWIGKIKTIAQMSAIPMLLYYESIFGLDIQFIGSVLIYVAALLTLYSMFVYLRAAAPYFDKEPKK